MIELPPVEVKENDVCVKMLAAPINPSDINRIEGLFYSLFFPSQKHENCSGSKLLFTTNCLYISMIINSAE